VSNNKLEVWIDADFMDTMTKVGTLSHDRGNVRFNYDKGWLAHPSRFDIDPDLSLDDATFHPNPEVGNFGIFLDSSPDRWGQTLMKRREALEAKDQKRSPRNLYAWDFLIGVQDLTRQGALRFKQEKNDTFLSSHELAAPPITALRELEAVARELTSKRIDDLDALRRWLRVLVAPGASLGGARPKANFKETDGSLWIAKFPAKDDDRDIGAWEGVVHKLAQNAKLDVPHAKIFKLNSEYHTFCVKRFDRNEERRIFYASAMTMLKCSESEGASYLDIAQFLMTNGAQHYVASDLEQLFRRVVFNVAVGNRDDHLRNHGFILTHAGWRLSPAFDVNPNMDKADHVLNLDDVDNRPSIGTVLETAEFYELDKLEAKQIAEEVISVIANWKEVAKKNGIANAEIELMEAAFMQYDQSEIS
jgi:serine/threonine-protein kinase HipA